MQVLKVFVIGMAAVIVIGTVVLAYGWTHHWAKTPSATETATSTPAVQAHTSQSDTAAGAAPYDLTVPAPDGMHFEQMVATGGQALLRFSGPQGERIVVVDPRSGRIAGTIGVPVSGK